MALLAARIGRSVHADLSQLKAGYGITTAASHYDVVKVGGASYQVAAGKTFTLCRVIINTSNVIAKIAVGYGDDAKSDSAVAPTNWVQLTAALFGQASVPNGIGFDLYAVVPASKYVHIFSYAGADPFTAHVEGFEA